MIGQLLLYQSQSHSPYRNLATEQYLLETLHPGQCILYLWQNENTVVIGKNQNPWKECKTALLETEGGSLARRLSGGGAVFHDLGNLNFTFLMHQEDYDVDRQLTVIQKAVEAMDIPVERSGRNDLLACGRKFSGNAFYKNGKQAYHHGTILISADMEKMGRYLNPSQAKLKAKGVDSVRSRVVNLRDLNPDVTIGSMRAALVDAFSQVYGLPLQTIHPADLDWDTICGLESRYESWEWLYGQKLPFTFACEEKFPWGEIQIQLQIENGIIQQVKVYSDAMDWALPPQLEEALALSRFDPRALEARLARFDAPIAGDLLGLLIQ